MIEASGAPFGVSPENWSSDPDTGGADFIVGRRAVDNFLVKDQRTGKWLLNEPLVARYAEQNKKEADSPEAGQEKVVTKCSERQVSTAIGMLLLKQGGNQERVRLETTVNGFSDARRLNIKELLADLLAAEPSLSSLAGGDFKPTGLTAEKPIIVRYNSKKRDMKISEAEALESPESRYETLELQLPNGDVTKQLVAILELAVFEPKKFKEQQEFFDKGISTQYFKLEEI